MSYTPVVNAGTLELYLGVCATGRCTASSTTLDMVSFGTVYNPRPSITFDPSDVGMPIAIVGGGPVDADMPPVYFVQGALFVTTIAAYVSPTEVTLTDAPDTSIQNTGFATVILYRPCPFASDVTNVPLQFQYNSSIAPGTNDTLQFSVLNTLGGVDNPYVDRFGPIMLGQPVYLKSTDSSIGDVFGGYIDTLETSSEVGVPGTPYCWSAQCAAWSGLARRRVVPPANPQVFTSIAGDQVFRNVVLDYLSNDGVAVSVSTAPDITLACAVGANIGQLLDQIVGLISTEDTAWYWTTDAWRTFILATRTGTAAPWDVSHGDDLFAGNTPYQQSITATHNQMANFVYAIGQNTLLNTLIANLVGNGSATTFNLPQPVGAVPTITLNSGAQTVGILGVDVGKDWYWSQGSNVLTQDSGGVVLGPSDSLVVTYTPETPAVAQAPNVASLQSLQAIEGTSATYEYSISLTQPILPADLLAFATAYEIEYGEPATTVQFYTLRPGLKTGQLQTIALPEAGIASGSYLIATVQMSTLDNVIVWQYTAFGGANIGDAITALTQFINRDQATLTLITPTTPITGPAVAASTGNSITVQQPLPFAAIVATLPSSVIAGNLLVVVAVRCGLTNPIVITDSQGNTWTQVVYASSTGFFPNNIALAWAFASATGSITVTSVSGNEAEYITVTEISGIDSAAPVDVFNGASGSAPSITTTAAGDVIISGVCWQGAGVPTVTAPETIIGSGLVGGPAGNIAVALANQSAAGSFTTTLSSNGGANPPDNEPVYISVAFKPAPPTAPPSQTTTVIANPSGTVVNSGALTADLPVFGNGGVSIKVGTKQGNTDQAQMASGSAGSTGAPLLYDANGNAVTGTTGQLVPPGGSTGEVLSKNSGTDGDTSWQPAGGLSVTTKGDLQGFSTVPARIPVGTDGEVLTADSTNPLGVSWQPGGAGGVISPNPASGAPSAQVPFTGWSIQNQSNAHGNFNDFLPNEIVMSAGNYATLQWSGLTRALPGATYTLICTIEVRGQLSGNVATLIGSVCLSDGTNYEQIEIALGTTSANVTINVRTLSSLSTGGSILTSSSGTLGQGLTLTVKIVNDGTHRTFSYWLAGAWVQLYQEASGTFLTETEAGVTGLTDINTGGYSVDVAVRYWSAV